MDKVENLILLIVKGIVSNPEAVELFVSDSEDEKGALTQVNVKVHKSDVGLCIGEAGRNAEALRRIVGLIGFQQIQRRVFLRVDSPKIPRKHFSFPEDESTKVP